MGYINRFRGGQVITIHRPNASGSNTNITATNPGSSNHWEMVDDVVSDGWTTCVYEAGATYKVDTYNFADPGYTGSIAWVKVVGNYAQEVAGITVAAKAAIYVGATLYYGTEFSKSSAGYSDFYHTWVTNPATGLPWTWAAINALQFGMAIRGNGTIACACSKVELHIARMI